MARTNNDQAHLRRLRDAYTQIGCLPSYRQIANILNFKAKNAAFKLSQRLIASGHLTKTVGGRLAPGPAFFTFELNEDEVKADFGAATNLAQPQTLNQLLKTTPSKTALITVQDDSMINEGILSGDVAIVDVGSQALSGDIVVAEINGTQVFKELRNNEQQMQFISQDWNSKNMIAETTLNVIGVVRGIIRSYRPPAISAVKMKG